MDMNMGNIFALPNLLNNLVGAQGNDSSDDQFNESSSSECEDNSLEVDSNAYNPTFIHEPTSSTNKFSTKANLSVEDVQNIEGDLDMYEIISLIFLLYESNLALQVIRVIHAYDLSSDLDQTMVKDKISNWARYQPSNWKPMLVEALAVIQNYKVLNKLGYEKEEVDKWCFPRRDVSLFINRGKKMLYLLCEGLSREQTRELIDLVNKDMTFENNITNDSNSIFLEYFLLFWISRRYLKLTDNEEVCLKNLTKHLKVIDFEKSEEIDNMVTSINIDRRKSGDLKKKNQEYENIYRIINPGIVGLCIIIDMYKFQKDKRKAFKDLVSTDNLRDREGSVYDVQVLTETFTHLKFKVEKLQSISHDCLKQEIQRTIKLHFKPDYSVLFLCILSHGSEGIIYAANCVPVTIQEIQSYVSGPSAVEVEDLLANKPKVMIVQACQGNKVLYVNSAACSSRTLNNDNKSNELQMDGGNLVFDGPEKFLPKHSDVLVCMAIIEGYMAVRGTKEGTKYIQELCRCLKNYYLDDHFLDIVIRVHDSLNAEEIHVDVSEEYSNCKNHKNCANIYMTPSQYGTLRKKLYLAPKS